MAEQLRFEMLLEQTIEYLLNGMINVGIEKQDFLRQHAPAILTTFWHGSPHLITLIDRLIPDNTADRHPQTP